MPAEGGSSNQNPAQFITTMTRLRAEGRVPGTEEFAARERREREESERREREESERRERERHVEEERRSASVGDRPEGEDLIGSLLEALATPPQEGNNGDDTDSLFGEPREDHGLRDDQLQDDGTANDPSSDGPI